MYHDKFHGVSWLYIFGLLYFSYVMNAAVLFCFSSAVRDQHGSHHDQSIPPTGTFSWYAVTSLRVAWCVILYRVRVVHSGGDGNQTEVFNDRKSSLTQSYYMKWLNICFLMPDILFCDSFVIKFWLKMYLNLYTSV